MNVHILCPFYRKYLYNTLIHYYGKMDVIFHPICDEVDIEPFKDNQIEWIKPFLCPPLKKGEQCYTKFNYFINAGDIVDEDYYGFVGDDDMYEDGLVTELKKIEADVIFISNCRGDKIPNDGGAPHPIFPLIPRERKDVYPGNIGLGMFFVKGYILKDLRFAITDGADDGRFAQNLANLPKNVVFMPNLFVFGNFFQPGRHTDKNKFLKLSWNLPVII